MPLPVNPNRTLLDTQRIFQRAFDEVNDRIRVDAVINTDVADVEVQLSYEDDSIAIGDPSTDNILSINPDGSIDVNIVSSGTTPIFSESADTLTTSGYEEIFSYTSTSDDTRITSVLCTASTPVTFRLKINGSIKKELRSSSLERNKEFIFRENRPLNNGDILTVEAKVERLILSSYDTFTSLEGYLL